MYTLMYNNRKHNICNNYIQQADITSFRRITRNSYDIILGSNAAGESRKLEK